MDLLLRALQRQAIAENTANAWRVYANALERALQLSSQPIDTAVIAPITKELTEITAQLLKLPQFIAASLTGETEGIIPVKTTPDSYEAFIIFVNQEPSINLTEQAEDVAVGFLIRTNFINRNDSWEFDFEEYWIDNLGRVVGMFELRR